jgi:exonuclease I
MEHCVTKIEQIVERGEPERKAILQLGYNLGRLSELTGLGREPFWDRWKDAVARWDAAELRRLAVALRQTSASWTSPVRDAEREC